MPIASSDILYKLSVTTGSAGDSTTQADPNASLGKYVSTAQLSGTALNNLFDDVSGDENATSTVEYRCLFVHNNHATLSLTTAKAWISGPRCAVTASDDTFTSTAHGLTDGMTVRLEAEMAGDVMPTGVNNSTTYYVRDSASNTFKLAATNGGSAINITSDGTVAARKYFGADEAIGLDPAGATAKGSASAQAATIANETSVPAGVTFTSPVTKSTGLAIGTLAAGQVYGIWVRRSANNGSAYNLDGLHVRVAGDTAA